MSVKASQIMARLSRVAPKFIEKPLCYKQVELFSAVLAGSSVAWVHYGQLGHGGRMLSSP